MRSTRLLSYLSLVLIVGATIGMRVLMSCGGGIDLQAGQPADTNINFAACTSIVRQGNGRFRLKPALRGGEVAVNSNQNAMSRPVIYWVSAQAFVPMSAGTNPGSPDCNPSSLPSTFDSTTQLTVAPGSTTTQNFAFTGCQ
jgi:hypothetical protein